MPLLSARSAQPEMLDYLKDLSLPLGIVILAIIFGVLIERLLLDRVYRFFDKREWKIGRRLIRSMNGIFTIWAGLLAFRTVLSDLPLKASALPAFEHGATAILILSITVLCGRVVVAFIRTYAAENDRLVPSISLVQNIVRAFAFTLGVVMIFHTYGIAVAPLLTALGVGGLAVALALQDTLSNFFAGIYIIISKHLDPGDYVKLDGGQEGIIRDIAWRVTTLQTPASTLVIVPNSKFSTSIITNYSKPDRAMNLVIDLPVDPAKDAALFEGLAIAAAQEVMKLMPEITAGEPVLRYTSLTTPFAASGATLQIILNVTEFTKASEVKSEILRRIYSGLHAAGTIQGAAQ